MWIFRLFSKWRGIFINKLADTVGVFPKAKYLSMLWSHIRDLRFSWGRFRGCTRTIGGNSKVCNKEEITQAYVNTQTHALTRYKKVRSIAET